MLVNSSRMAFGVMGGRAGGVVAGVCVLVCVGQDAWRHEGGLAQRVWERVCVGWCVWASTHAGTLSARPGRCLGAAQRVGYTLRCTCGGMRGGEYHHIRRHRRTDPGGLVGGLAPRQGRISGPF